jgi:hypothetical protein
MATDDLKAGHVRDPDGTQRPMTLREAICVLGYKQQRFEEMASTRDRYEDRMICEEIGEALGTLHAALDAIARGIGAS